jgi:hypothetical protein
MEALGMASLDYEEWNVETYSEIIEWRRTVALEARAHVSRAIVQCVPVQWIVPLHTCVQSSR